MTTTVFHANLQRDRFAQHAIAALAGLIPAALRLVLRTRQPAAPAAKSESAAVEAQNVRRMARSYAKTDPGFAADLYAAAARHEGLYAD